MKHVLTIGCSFTNNTRMMAEKATDEPAPSEKSWPWYLTKKLGKNYKVYNYGSATLDNPVMCRSLLYHIDRLIKSGVPSENIIVLIQWSDAARQSFFVNKKMGPEEYCKYGHTYVYNTNWKQTPGIFYLTGGYHPPQGKGHASDWLGIDNFITYLQAELNWDNIFNQIMHWFELWLLLKKTCDELNIPIKYMFMRDTVVDIPLEHELLKPYIDQVPLFSEDVWYHNKTQGLLEWTIDNIQEGVPYFQEAEGKYYTWENYKNQVHKYGWGHPSPEMMELFVEQELFEHIQDIL